MEANDLKSMDADELWKLHEELRAQLGSRLVAEKNKLEERLRALRSRSGRGKLPRWLSTQIKAGKKLNNFLIASSDAEK